MKGKFKVSSEISIKQIAGNHWGLFIGEHLDVTAYDKSILERMLEDEYK